MYSFAIAACPGPRAVSHADPVTRTRGADQDSGADVDGHAAADADNGFAFGGFSVADTEAEPGYLRGGC